MACELSENTIALEGNTEYTGNLSGFGDVDTYSFTMTENETITFKINIVNDDGSGTLPNATLKLFRLSDGDVGLGTSFLQRQNNIFTYDGIVGDYYFCLENLYACEYTLLVEFTDYNGIIFDRMYCHSGEYSDGDFPEVVIPPCNQRVAYKIVNGVLPIDIGNFPETFTFESSGIIYGTAGEQDCESESFESPSWNWKKYDQSSGLKPTSKKYRIIVRAYFIEYPYVYLDQEVQVCVHNNWDYDEPDILNLQRTEYDVSYIDIEVEDGSLCMPCKETKEIVTERIIKFNKFDIDGFLGQLDSMMYEKQCMERHKLPELDHVYHEPKKVKEKLDDLCPICPDDK